MTKSKDGVLPRLINKTTAAAYCGNISEPTFNRYVSAGVLPPRVRGTNLWDRKAIDFYLDRASGLLPTTPETTKPSEQPAPNTQAWLNQLDVKTQTEGREGLHR